MKKLTMILLAMLTILSSVNALCGTVKCPDNFVILEGTGSFMAGYTYTEHVEMYRISGSKGYDGKWKIDLFRQVTTYPHAINPPITTDNIVEFGYGMKMHCHAVAGGNQVVSTCTEGNLILDVVNNRIGSTKTNIWIGKIYNKQVTLKFHNENPFEPTLTGTIQELKSEKITLDIVSPTADQKFIFSSAKPGKLQIKLKANVIPKDKAGSVKWTLPEIAGSKKTAIPATATGEEIELNFEDLPAQNAAFGKKTIKAELDLGMCKVEDEKEIAIFFPRDEKNNPDGNVPNWFYYWSQTPAKIGPAKFGGTTGKCSRSDNGRDGLIGYYRYIKRDKHYYICDLSRLPGDFNFEAVTVKNGNSIDSIKMTGIDTFAVASRHENEHYEHFKKWWFHFNPNPIRSSGGHMMPGYDKDGDFIPNTKEPGLNLDPNTKYTLRQHDASINVDDEEWLAWIAESTWTKGSADKEDWAKPGKQWK